MAAAVEEDDDDLKFVRASGKLLEDLEAFLPRLLWKPAKFGVGRGRVHTQARRRDVQLIINLIEPFQGEPQLLDAHLKQILPPVVDAYLEYLTLEPRSPSNNNLDFQTAVCSILYTLCKVRGYKVIVGFLNNEPRYLEPILQAVERTIKSQEEEQVEWQVPYVLLLWLSHLLLTPFDLASISTDEPTQMNGEVSGPTSNLPFLAKRVLRVGHHYLPLSTKAQEAAAAMLVRLSTRPDMQKLQLADTLVSQALGVITSEATIYERLGPMRYLAGIATSADLSHLVPSIYRACEQMIDDSTLAITNAVTKKILVKIFRNIAILTLRSTSATGPLSSFMETTSILEDVIDFLLRSLADRDTPVRYAAAKATSLIILELDPEKGFEVIQAVLDTFKEDIPRHGDALDFRMVNPLKWHGLTLALSHTLFKRTASPEQLPDIVNALFAALQFEQRTATGSSVGANVRDAANFGIWSLSRRYTSDELLAVETSGLTTASATSEPISVIQSLAIQLILSACLDPAGNIRRGSSAALQELVGRHPNQIYEGISLVQIVDYQAVGLRRRAMVNVAYRAAEMHPMYWDALIEGILGWRGLGSADVVSRESVAISLGQLSHATHASEQLSVVERVSILLKSCQPSEVEQLHGLVSTMSCIIDEAIDTSKSPSSKTPLCMQIQSSAPGLWSALGLLQFAIQESSARVMRSELPTAVARYLGALSRFEARFSNSGTPRQDLPFDSMDTLADYLLSRQEDTLLHAVPLFVPALFFLANGSVASLASIDAQSLCSKVATDGTKRTTHGAGRAIALGAIAMQSESVLTAVETLAGLIGSPNVDWRIIGLRALQVAVESLQRGHKIEERIFSIITNAVSRGMRDYTIDERGDIGSLVRLQAIACTSSIFTVQSDLGSPSLQKLRSEIIRLSFEKLDRVRIQAVQCREKFLDLQGLASETLDASSRSYFTHALSLLADPSCEPQILSAILEGCMSCAGAGAEPLLQASRLALVDILTSITNTRLSAIMLEYSTVLKNLLTDSTNMAPALELLAFLLDMHILQRLVDSGFKWRNLLSTVQKSHHKSNDIPKILAAVSVYRGLTEVPAIRGEVVKKLVSMLKTNPYPRIRCTVAETLLLLTKDEEVKTRDWMRPPSEHKATLEGLQKRYVTI